MFYWLEMKLLLLLCWLPLMEAVFTIDQCEVGGMKCSCECPDLDCVTTTPPTTTTTTTVTPTTTTTATVCDDDPCITLEMSPFTECAVDLPGEIIDYMKMDCEAKKEDADEIKDLFNNIEVICLTKGHDIELVPFSCPTTEAPTTTTTEGPCSPCDALDAADYVACSEIFAEEMKAIIRKDCASSENNVSLLTDFFDNIRVVCSSNGYEVELNPVCATTEAPTTTTTEGPCSPCDALDAADYVACSEIFAEEMKEIIRKDCASSENNTSLLTDFFDNIRVVCSSNGYEVELNPVCETTTTSTTPTVSATEAPCGPCRALDSAPFTECEVDLSVEIVVMMKKDCVAKQDKPDDLADHFSNIEVICLLKGHDIQIVPPPCTTTPPVTTTTTLQVTTTTTKPSVEVDFTKCVCTCVGPDPPTPAICMTTPAPTTTTTTCSPGGSVCDGIREGKYWETCAKEYDPVVVDFMVSDCEYFEENGTPQQLKDFIDNLCDVCKSKSGERICPIAPPGDCTTTPPATTTTTTTCTPDGSVCDGIKEGKYWKTCAKEYDPVIVDFMVADCEYFEENGTPQQLKDFINNLCDVCESKSGESVCPIAPPGDCNK